MLEPQKTKVKKEDLGEITQAELSLLYYIRNRFRFGEITLVVRDGQPYRILKAFESTDL